MNWVLVQKTMGMETIEINLLKLSFKKFIENLKPSSIIETSYIYWQLNWEIAMIEIWSKPNCVFCDKAVMLCRMKSLEFKKYMLDVDYTREDFVEKFPEARTFPQITMDGKYIGGFTELDSHLA